jgi:hypothetical protein
MIVQFEATLDDFIAVSLRSLARSKTQRSLRIKRTVYNCLLAGLLTPILVPGSIWVKVFAGCLAAGITIPVDRFFYRRSLQKSLRELCREHIGGDKPFRVRVELNESGILIEQLNTQMTIGWADVTEIKEIEDAVYFFWRVTECLAVNMRAFESAESKQRFIETALFYMNSSRKSSQSTPADSSR